MLEDVLKGSLSFAQKCFFWTRSYSASPSGEEQRCRSGKEKPWMSSGWETSALEKAEARSSQRPYSILECSHFWTPRAFTLRAEALLWLLPVPPCWGWQGGCPRQGHRRGSAPQPRAAAPGPPAPCPQPSSLEQGALGQPPRGRVQPGTAAALPLLPSPSFFPIPPVSGSSVSAAAEGGRGGAAVTEHPVTSLRAWGAIKGLSMGLVIQCVHTHARTPPAADTEEDPGRRTRWGKLWLHSSCVSWRQASRAEGFLLLSSLPSHAASPAPAGVLLPLSKGCGEERDGCVREEALRIGASLPWS